jgi:histidinol-phosphate aminotransferase
VDRLSIWPAAANFVLTEALGNGPAVVAGLRAVNIAVRPAESFPGLGPDHIRLAVRRPALHAQLVDALREVLT